MPGYFRPWRVRNIKIKMGLTSHESLASHGMDGREGRGQTRTRRRSWLTPYKRNEKAASQEWRCRYCQVLLPALFHIDHFIPLSEGGPDTLDNLCAACPKCHAIKSATETQRYWDRRRETITGLSKYFQPESTYFIPFNNPPQRYFHNKTHFGTD